MCVEDPAVLIQVKNHNGNKKFNYRDHNFFKTSIIATILT